MRVDAGQPLRVHADRPRMAGRDATVTGDLVVGEWSLWAATWTDRHEHEEVNVVLDGELHVTCDGTTRIARAGDTVVAAPGELVRYEAPVFARMLYVYGPSLDGHATHDAAYDER